MVKKQQKSTFQVRDWLLFFLFVSVVVTNIFWAMHVQALQTTDANYGKSWVTQQVQINALRDCIDNGTKPCDITAPTFDK